MTPLIFLIFPLFAIWSGTPETGYDQSWVAVSNDMEEACNHTHANGCLVDFDNDGDLDIVVINPFKKDPYGCTLLGHEYFHLQLGLEENELPFCWLNQEFRK